MAYSFCFWEPEISPHKLPLFRALAARPEVSSATYYYDADLGAARRALGWAPVVGDGERVFPAGTRNAVEAAILDAPRDCVHIFSGMHWVPSIVQGLRLCVKHGRRFGLLHEPRVLEGWKGKARLAHSWLTEAHLRRHADFVLAIGAHGPRWFRLSGFSEAQIVPFAYFLPWSDQAARGVQRMPKIGFVGRLERAKGFHRFLEAMAVLGEKVEVSIAGTGSLAGQAKTLLDEGTLRGTFHGALPFEQVPDIMNGLDLLVLPSTTTDDGWGAVVSEALMAGIAVLCSDRAGASMCIVDPRLGAVVTDLSGKGVASAIGQVLERQIFGPDNRDYRRQWARERLSQEAGAAYLLAVLDSVYGGKMRPESFVR